MHVKRALLVGLISIGGCLLPRGSALAKTIPYADALVGADGRTAIVRLNVDLFRGYGDMTKRVPPGNLPYLLLYPIQKSGMAYAEMQYYPSAGLACGLLASDADSRLRSRGAVACSAVRGALAKRLRRASAPLARFAEAPTRITALRRGNRQLWMPSGVATTIQYALARTAESRAALVRPSCAQVYEARWSGAAAPRKPAELCITDLGLWADGRLYPLRPAVVRELIRS